MSFPATLKIFRKRSTRNLTRPLVFIDGGRQRVIVLDLVEALIRGGPVVIYTNWDWKVNLLVRKKQRTTT